MKDIIIIGTGAVAAEWTMYLRDIHDVQLKGYLEYSSNIEKYYNQYNYEMPILGDIDSYIPQENDYFLLGISDITFRNVVIDKMQVKGARFITLIHPTALIAEDAIIGVGCTIAPFCMIGPKTVLGDFNQLTAYSAVSHDCVLGRNNTFSSVIVCGHTKIGNNNSFYIRSTVQPNLNIGNNNVIQAGMMVDKNISDDTTVFYRFKEQILAIPKQN